MSSTWSRFKQSTREVIGKSEKSETPADVQELAAHAERLQEVLEDVMAKSEFWIVPEKAKSAPAGRPLVTLGSAWTTLADQFKDQETRRFIQDAADTVTQIGEAKAEIDTKVWAGYMDPKTQILRMHVKEGHGAIEKLKTRRLDLDSKKHKLNHADADKVAHYQQSVALAQDRYDQTVNNIREYLGPLADDAVVGSGQADQVAVALAGMLECFRKGAEMLEELDARVGFSERAKVAASRPSMPVAFSAEKRASQSSLSSAAGVSRAGSGRNTPSLTPSSSQTSLNIVSAPAQPATQFHSAGSPTSSHPSLMNGAVALPHLQTASTTGGTAAPRRGPPPPVAQRKPSGMSVPQNVPKAVALYDFTAQEPTDLSFRKDNVIILKSTDGDWWEGTLNGKTGSFPRNYVERI